MEDYLRLKALLITWLLGNGMNEKEAEEFAGCLIELRKSEVANERKKFPNAREFQNVSRELFV